MIRLCVTDVLTTQLCQVGSCPGVAHTAVARGGSRVWVQRLLSATEVAVTLSTVQDEVRDPKNLIVETAGR